MKIMRIISIILAATGILFCTEAGAQIQFKTEYLGNSHYMHTPEDIDAKNEKVGSSKGSAVVHSGSAQIPFYMKMNENNRPTAWGIGLSGSYASLNNTNFTDDLGSNQALSASMMVSDIMNLQLGLFHIRPISEKWSMMASLGAGIYTPFGRFSKIGWEHVLGSGGVILIWHLKPNLDLGGGLAINNSLGYPMVFPALYVNWRLDGKFKVNVSMGEGIELSGKYEFNDWFSTALAFEVNGQMALMKRDGKRMMFTHQYMVVGLKPEVKLGQTGLSLFAMAGLNAYRPAEYSELTLKAIFAQDDSYFFRAAPYASAGIKFGF